MRKFYRLNLVAIAVVMVFAVFGGGTFLWISLPRASSGGLQAGPRSHGAFTVRSPATHSARERRAGDEPSLQRAGAPDGNSSHRQGSAGPVAHSAAKQTSEHLAGSRFSPMAGLALRGIHSLGT